MSLDGKKMKLYEITEENETALKRCFPAFQGFRTGAPNQNRTGDLILTMDEVNSFIRRNNTEL